MNPKGFDLRGALFGLTHDVKVSLQAGATEEDVLKWLSNKVALLKQESNGVIANKSKIVSKAPKALEFCPGCDAPLESFKYRENGVDFDSFKCSKECGWWS